MIEKGVQKVGLDTYPVDFIDRSQSSPNYFDIISIPNKLTAGKNILKLRGGTNLAPDSPIFIDVLDSNGNSIYHEVLDYMEDDGTRVISIHVYPDTAPGQGTIYIAGRATAFPELNPNIMGTNIMLPDETYFTDTETSEIPYDDSTISSPNVKWVHELPIAPNERNSSEIIFLSGSIPEIDVRESVKSYFEQTYVDKRNMKVTGSSLIKMISQGAVQTALQPAATVTAQTRLGSPSFGRTIQPNSDINPDQTIATSVVPIVVQDSTAPVIEITSGNFAFSSSMEGGTIELNNPIISVQNGTVSASTNYKSTIVKVLSKTQARVADNLNYSHIIQPDASLGNVSDLVSSIQTTLIRNFEPSPFTCSFVAKPFFTTTENSQSYADIRISGLNPATGDVYKVRSYMKPLGAVGEYDLVNETILNQQNLLIYTGSNAEDIEIGKWVPLGSNPVAKDPGTYPTYWTWDAYVSDNYRIYMRDKSGNSDATKINIQRFDETYLIDGIKFQRGSGTKQENFGDHWPHKLQEAYWLDFYKNSNYKILFNAYSSFNINRSPAPTAPFNERGVPDCWIDVYMSGSSFTDPPPYGKDRIQLESLGKYIGTLYGPGDKRFDDISFDFAADRTGNGTPNFVIRAGDWHLSDIQIVPDLETGFSPNFQRVVVTVPTLAMNAEQQFKFQYYDYKGNQADYVTEVFGAVFDGSNTYIAGNRNLLSGSMFLSNTIGEGIEIAGKSSGYMRNVGYEGWGEATSSTGPSGFIIFSGSVLPDSATPYDGVGLEMASDNKNYMRFRTSPPVFELRTENIHLSGSSVIINTPTFFLGAPGNYLSGSNGLIEISSSHFVLSPAGNITATGGNIAGWNIGSTSINKTSATGGVSMKSDYNRITFRTGSGGTTEVTFLGNINTLGSPLYGIKQLDTNDVSKTIFKLGEDGNEIAGWTIDNEKLTGGAMIIRKDGTIESDGFATNVAGSGFRLTAADGGFLEVENARIRGTLSTAVFEKESVNAVGGQLYIANSTVFTSSLIAPQGIHSASMTTMSVVNSSGFVQGEVISAKKVSQTGFSTEYMFVDSASRVDQTSDTNLSGYLFVQRGYSGSIPGVTSSLGDFASKAQTYSGSQVIVSTGRIGTGYIRLNANPNDITTPYIDIVERTGSAIYDIDLKARIGDLSGITDNSFSDGVTGYGIYTGKGYYKGKIEIVNPDDFGTRPKTDYKIALVNTGSASQPTYYNSTRFISQSMGYSNVTFAFTSSASGSDIPGYESENYDLYIFDEQAWGLSSVNEIQRSLDLFEKGKSVLVTGNDTKTINVTASGGTTWPIKEYEQYAAGTKWMAGLAATGSGLAAADPILVGWGTGSAVWSTYTSTDGGYSVKKLQRSPGGAATVVPIAVSGSTQMETTDDDYVQGSGEVIAWYMTNPQGGRYVCLHLHGLNSINNAGTSTGPVCAQQKRIVEFLLKSTQPQEAYQSGVTTITGNMVSTGIIQSTNWGTTAGSQFNLNQGTFYLGGSSNPKLSWDESTLNVVGKIEVTNEGASLLEAGATYNFGGASGSVIPQAKLVTDGEVTGSQWYQNSTTKHRTVNGVLFQSSSGTTTWDAELRSKQRFNREDVTFTADVTIKELSGHPTSFPRVMFGLGDPINHPPGTNPSLTYKNNAHAFFFYDDNIKIYESTIPHGGLIHSGVAPGDKFRLWIRPNISAEGGALYKVFKYPNLSGSIVDASTVGDSQTASGSILDVGVWSLADTETFSVDNIQITAPGAVSTVIEGDKITTGKVRSTNWSSTAGTMMDLDNEKIIIGGSQNESGLVDGIILDGATSGQAKFYVGDEDSYMRFNDTAGKLEISGSNIDLFTPTFFLGDQNTYLSGSSGNIRINADIKTGLPPEERLEFLQDDNELRFYLTESIQSSSVVKMGTGINYKAPNYYGIVYSIGAGASPYNVEYDQTGIVIHEPRSFSGSAASEYITGSAGVPPTGSTAAFTALRDLSFHQDNLAGSLDLGSLTPNGLTVKSVNATGSLSGFPSSIPPEAFSANCMLMDYIHTNANGPMGAGRTGFYYQHVNMRGGDGHGITGYSCNIWNSGSNDLTGIYCRLGQTPGPQAASMLGADLQIRDSTTEPVYSRGVQSIVSIGDTRTGIWSNVLLTNSVGTNYGVYSSAQGSTTNNWSFYGPNGEMLNLDTYDKTVGGTYRSMYVDNTGVFGGMASDIRLKTNIVTATGSLEKIKSLRGVYFNWKDSGSRGTDRQVGMIAQEVENIIPEIVPYVTGSWVSQSLDALMTGSGGPFTEPEWKEAYKWINYEFSIPLLVEAIKEQQTIIETLTTRIATLESGSS